MRKITLNSLVIIVFTILISYDALSIPAFARKYKLSCQTCHNPFPRLKPFGDEFAGNGFKLANQEAPRYYEETGDPLLQLIRDFPIAVRLEGHLTYNVNNRELSDLGVPYLMKFLSGGEIANDISYYFYFYFDERGEVAGVEDAYLMFNDVFNTDLDVYAGQFQVSDPLYKRELRLTLEDYQLYKYAPEFSGIDLTYDKGIMLIYGFDWGTNLVFELVNGNGLRDAENQIFDNDQYKNVMGRISQDLGDIVRVGAFAYWGKEERTLPNENLPFTNEVVIWGPDASVSITDMFELNLQYINRKDQAFHDFNTDAALAELIFLPEGDDSRWYAAALYNYIYSTDETLDNVQYKYQSVTGHLGYLLHRNIRLVTEYTYDFSNINSDFSRFSVGFVSAF